VAAIFANQGTMVLNILSVEETTALAASKNVAQSVGFRCLLTPNCPSLEQAADLPQILKKYGR
jgi:hypothetical protein